MLADSARMLADSATMMLADSAGMVAESVFSSSNAMLDTAETSIKQIQFRLNGSLIM